MASMFDINLDDEMDEREDDGTTRGEGAAFESEPANNEKEPVAESAARLARSPLSPAGRPDTRRVSTAPSSMNKTSANENENEDSDGMNMPKFWVSDVAERTFEVGLHGENTRFTQKIRSLFTSGFDVTDIHITEQKPVWIRTCGDMMRLNLDVPLGGIQSLCSNLFGLPSHDRVNSSCGFLGKRLRLRFSKTMNKNQLFIRILPGRAPSLASIGHENTFEAIRRETSPGIVFVAGATGSGKSTMLASLLQEFLNSSPVHITTVEDPVEYALFDGVGTVSQRQIPEDVNNFSEAVRDSLREDPDIIFIGEMRDPETAKAALTASETGHTVFATIHASSVPGILDRLSGMLEDVKDARFRIAAAFLGGIHLSLERREDGVAERKTYILWANDESREKIRNLEFHKLATEVREICGTVRT